MARGAACAAAADFAVCGRRRVRVRRLCCAGGMSAPAPDVGRYAAGVIIALFSTLASALGLLLQKLAHKALARSLRVHGLQVVGEGGCHARSSRSAKRSRTWR